MNIRILIYLLRPVSAYYYGHHQVISQLHKRKYIEVQTSPMQTMSIKYL